MRYRADLAYDGTDFHGWQRQAQRRTVQGVIEAAVRSVTGEAVTVVGAGRTDAGVHATGQVAHFDTAWMKGCAELARAVNAVLPEDVAVLGLAPAAPGFHARFGALARRYRYTLWVAPVRSPLERRTSLHVVPPLAVAGMAEAAAGFVGVHDLAAFGRPLVAGGSTVRRIDRCEIRAEGQHLWIEVEGNAFLRHQVRRMVGVLIEVGRGRVRPEAVLRALAGDASTLRPVRAPAQGLALVAVSYPAGEDVVRAGMLEQEQGERDGEDVYAEEN